MTRDVFVFVEHFATLMSLRRTTWLTSLVEEEPQQRTTRRTKWPNSFVFTCSKVRPSLLNLSRIITPAP